MALQEEFPFMRVKGELPYLGIKLTTSLEKIYSANYIPLLNEIKAEDQKTNIQSITWIGRVNTLKMVILPKILYKFQMLPIGVPQSFFKTIQKIPTKFIWRNGKPRLKFSLISRKRQHGWLAAPDIFRYYKAVNLSHMFEWTKENREKKWIEIENTLSKTTLHKNIWISNKYRTLDLNTHGLTKNAFRIWDALHRKQKWVHNSPLIALNGTKFFSPGEDIF